MEMEKRYLTLIFLYKGAAAFVSPLQILLKLIRSFSGVINKVIELKTGN